MSHLKLTKISGHGLIFVAITNKLKNKDFAKQLIIKSTSWFRLQLGRFLQSFLVEELYFVGYVLPSAAQILQPWSAGIRVSNRLKEDMLELEMNCEGKIWGENIFFVELNYFIGNGLYKQDNFTRRKLFDIIMYNNKTAHIRS